MKNAILFFCLLVSYGMACAQPAHINFTSLTTKDGLLSNTVNAIIKDGYGLMWIATDDGLNKFDGTNFTVYRHIPGDTGSLRANEILALFEDARGNLWVGTSGGAVSVYDRKKDRFIHFPAAGDSSGLVPNAVVRGICTDKKGKIWIAQYEHPYRIDPVDGKITRFDLDNETDASPAELSLTCIFSDSKGRIWVGTNKGLFLYNIATRSFKAFGHDPAGNRSRLQNDVRVIAEDHSGRIWIGTTGGLRVVSSDRPGLAAFEKATPAYELLAKKAINTLVADPNGKLWIGTMEGLHVLDPQSGDVVQYLPDGNIHGLTSKAIKSIYIDKEGIYWLGTDRGGINKYDRNLNLFDVKLGDAFPSITGKNAIVTSFAERRDGRIWVGTDGAGAVQF